MSDFERIKELVESEGQSFSPVTDRIADLERRLDLYRANGTEAHVLQSEIAGLKDENERLSNNWKTVSTDLTRLEAERDKHKALAERRKKALEPFLANLLESDLYTARGLKGAVKVGTHASLDEIGEARAAHDAAEEERNGS